MNKPLSFFLGSLDGLDPLVKRERIYLIAGGAIGIVSNQLLKVMRYPRKKRSA